MKKLVLIAFVAALACLSVAQGGGQGRRMMMGGGRGMGMGVRFAMRSDVAKELALTAEQKTALDKAADELGPMRMRFGGGGPGGNGPGAGGPDRAEIEKMMAERREKEKKAIDTILTPDQVKRLKELSVQRAGNSALMDPEVQKDLSFTDAQKSKVKELQEKQMEAMQAIGEKLRNQEMDFESARPLFEKNRKIMEDELAKILTADQKKKFDEMGGKKFTFDPEQDRGPGGGR